MSATILEVFDNEVSKEILFTALEQYEKRCEGIANREIQGYGKATEYAMKEKWRYRAEQVRQLATQISEELI